MNTPHKHSELIKKWADGAEVEYLTEDGRWLITLYPLWQDHKQYRLKQEVTTSLSVPDLRRAYYRGLGKVDFGDGVHENTPMNRALRAVADAAIKQYIKDSANKA